MACEDVVMAGFGRRSGWFCNALGNDEVEVVLPGTVLRGAASEITDPQRRRAALVALCTSMGLPGLAAGDVRHASPERLDELADGLPVLAITPTAVLPGPFDPGGWANRLNTAFWTLVPIAAGVAVGAAARRRSTRR